MENKLKRVVSIISMMFLFNFTAFGQSHFVYFQSENNTPFYLRINNSLKNSSAKGYMILHQFPEGKHVVVIGLAGKRVPEAAFQLKYAGNENKGFLIKNEEGVLNLRTIQSKKVIKPIETATAAGNRIRTLPEEQQNDTDKTEIPEKVAKTKKEEKSEGVSFGNMLNAVTGSSNVSDVPKEKKPVDQNDSSKLVKNMDAGESENDKEEGGLFDELLKKNKKGNNKKKQKENKPVAEDSTLIPPTENNETEPKAPQKETSDLAFLDFDNLSSASKKAEPKETEKTQQDSINDKILPEEKDIKNQKKKKKRLSFDDLLKKIDTSTVDSQEQSLAKPLLSKEEKVANRASCESVADAAYFKKVKRKIAAKSNTSSMLRLISRYFSDDQCFTISQIREISYLFASEETRFQFLKKAYPHCADQPHFKKLKNTLDSPYYKRQLKAFLP